MQFKLTSPLQTLLPRHVLTTGALALTMMICAIAMVVSKHSSRVMHASCQAIQTEKDYLDNEWNQLLLEKATWTSALRVEQIAVEQLQMLTPTKIEIIKP